MATLRHRFMTRSRARRCMSVLAVAALSWVSTPLLSAQIVLQVDANNSTVRLADARARGRMVDSISDHTFRLRSRATVQFQVVNTNTALYRFATAETAGPAPAVLGPIRQFAPLLKAYLPELQYVVPRGQSRGAEGRTTILPDAVPENLSSSSARFAEVALQEGRSVELELHALDEVVHGAHGIDGVEGMSLRTVDRMRRGDIEALARAKADSLGVPPRSCQAAEPAASPNASATHLGSDVLAHLATLRPATAALATTLTHPALKDASLSELHGTLQVLRSRADSALHDAETLVTAAYQTDDLAATVMSACSHWESPPVTVSATSGRTVTLTIDPSSTPEIARVAPKKVPQTVKITLLPPIDRLDARFGLTTLYVPQAQFHKYGVRSTGAAGAAPQIYESEFVDNRFSYGISLGLTWHPLLDWRDRTNWALWLPEISVADAGGPKAFALGTAISYGIVKLGVGAAMIRHQMLDTLGLGQPIPNDKFLKTRDTYGHPLTYISLTVFGLAELFKGEPNK
jgi:hypothetical protein